jgi:hypothetical protein
VKERPQGDFSNFWIQSQKIKEMKDQSVQPISLASTKYEEVAIIAVGDLPSHRGSLSPSVRPLSALRFV